MADHNADHKADHLADHLAGGGTDADRWVASRRAFLSRTLGASAAVALLKTDLFARGAYAEALTGGGVVTPAQTEGPFYPRQLPLDADNDLLIVDDAITPAVGEVTHLSGRVTDRDGRPVRDATVEIWQVDHGGVYLHADSRGADRRDVHFQGFGRFVTGRTGEYRFRTIKPVPYPGRTPHIHVKVKRGGRDLLTTQCYVRGHPLNARDGVLRSIRDVRARESVMIDFAPLPDSAAGELAARFDLVLGFTPPA